MMNYEPGSASMPSVISPPDDISHPVVLFDGVCGLCNRFVDWLLRHDQDSVLRFATLQGRLGARYTSANDKEWLSTVVLVDRGRIYDRSTAALRSIGMLGWPWKLAHGLLVIPRPIRDTVYRFIATNRYRWFGKHESCRMPSAEERGRFLE